MTTKTTVNTSSPDGSNEQLSLAPDRSMALTVGRRKRMNSSSQNRALIQGRRTIYTAGRPPWYDETGQVPCQEAFVLGISGGSGSGKTTVAEKIISALDIPWVTMLSMDSFYRVLTDEEHEKAIRCEYNFDCINAFDVDLLVKTLKRVKSGKKVDVPIYNFSTHAREKEVKTLYGASVIIFEGIFAFCDERILDLIDFKLFVDTDCDIRLLRRLRRDISERDRDLDGVLKQYFSFVKPSYDMEIQPRTRYADMILPVGGENQVAIDLVVDTVHSELKKRGFQLFHQLKESVYMRQNSTMPSSLYVLPSQNQIFHLQTQLRDRTTERDDFIFYSTRLMRLLFEHTMSLLPYEDVVVNTPQHIEYHGKKCTVGQEICGVSIMRAGETMESALSEVCKDVRLGKILIQTNDETGEPELYYLRLPSGIKNMHVVLMDSSVSSGAAAMMAIRVLLDHDVPEDSIYMVSLLVSTAGVHNIAYCHPGVHIVTTGVDQADSQLRMMPGFGNFGDRFFGTERVDYDYSSDD